MDCGVMTQRSRIIIMTSKQLCVVGVGAMTKSGPNIEKVAISHRLQKHESHPFIYENFEYRHAPRCQCINPTPSRIRPRNQTRRSIRYLSKHDELIRKWSVRRLKHLGITLQIFGLHTMGQVILWPLISLFGSEKIRINMQ